MDTQHSKRNDSQSELESILNTFIAETFRLQNLINLEPGWQVNIADEDGVVIGTGASIEEAFAAAKKKAANGEYVGRFSLDKLAEPSNLLERLGFQRAKPPQVTRRI